MNIGIVGTRGIPNYYGGFEECAQQIGTRLAAKGHSVLVYNSHRHPFQQKTFEGVDIIHKYDPEHRIGTAGQFIYDLNCILDARWRKFDVILMLGYTSSSIWQRFLPDKAIVITNMDGLEWKRSKYSKRVQQFLKKAESWAAKGSHLLIADSLEIDKYLTAKFKNQVIFIPYGATKFKKPNPELLTKYGVEAGNYNLVVARLEPENNIETILGGIQKSKSQKLTLVIGNHETEYGEYLKNTYRDSRIRFIKGVYKKESIHNLRYFSNVFFHGHSVGGTNPSLLEAMGCSCMISAHDNAFNREVLGEDATYFSDVNDVANAADLLERNDTQKAKIKANLIKIRDKYNWDLVADQYEIVMEQSLI
jgi:glycosyltransferase involved in cell wall biosynthesis